VTELDDRIRQSLARQASSLREQSDLEALGDRIAHRDGRRVGHQAHRAGRLGDSPREVHVAVAQSRQLMRQEAHVYALPAQVGVRMMIRGIGQFADPAHQLRPRCVRRRREPRARPEREYPPISDVVRLLELLPGDPLEHGPLLSSHGHGSRHSHTIPRGW
jgi:hypothetical protein